MAGLPFQLRPSIGTDLFPDTVQSMPQLRTSISTTVEDASIGQEAIDAASKIIEESSSVIRGYFLGQRHNAAVSGLDVYGHSAPFSGGSMRYSNQYGAETLHISVDVQMSRPEKASSSAEPEEGFEPEPVTPFRSKFRSTISTHDSPRSQATHDSPRSQEGLISPEMEFFNRVDCLGVRFMAGDE